MLDDVDLYTCGFDKYAVGLLYDVDLDLDGLFRGKLKCFNYDFMLGLDVVLVSKLCISTNLWCFISYWVWMWFSVLSYVVDS